MIETLKIVLLTILLLANFFLLGVSVYFWKLNKDTSSKIGFTYMMVLEFANMILIGGTLL